jgi:hypothetical protein
MRGGATCFDSPETSSGPQGSDPYNDMCYNTLWDPKRLQWYFIKTTDNEMNGNTLQGKVLNTGEFKYSESPAWG